MNYKASAVILLLALLGMALFFISNARLGIAPSRSLAASDSPVPPPPPCPIPTQELPPEVEPVTSPTDLSTQTIYVWFPAEWIMVVNEIGSFKIFCDSGPCHAIPILLKPNSVNHLTVVGKVRPVVQWEGCVYGGYLMDTSLDKNGNPLEIEQIGGKLYSFFLPLASR
jgi:hypothetical protein